MELVGLKRLRFVRCLHERSVHALNRKKRKKLYRAGVLPSARKLDRPVALTKAQAERLNRQHAGKKEKKPKVRYPKPGMAVQIMDGSLVVGRERSSACMVHKSVVEVPRISRQLAHLIGVAAEKRNDVDRRAEYIHDKPNGRHGSSFLRRSASCRSRRSRNI